MVHQVYPHSRTCCGILILNSGVARGLVAFWSLWSSMCWEGTLSSPHAVPCCCVFLRRMAFSHSGPEGCEEEQGLHGAEGSTPNSCPAQCYDLWQRTLYPYTWIEMRQSLVWVSERRASVQSILQSHPQPSRRMCTWPSGVAPHPCLFYFFLVLLVQLP